MGTLAGPVLAIVMLLVVTSAARGGSDVTLFRLFLLDGSTVVSYGEFARVDDRVVLSMPVGGSRDEPRLHVVSLPATSINWPRTDRYATSARYQRYAETRGEADFQTLSTDVARTLNDIALTTDRAKALAIAEEARRMLAEWPAAHMGYRHRDVREIVALVEDAIAGLKGLPPTNGLDLTLVALSAPELEPMLGMPTAAEQLDQLSRVLAVTVSAPERVALLQSGLLLVRETPAMAGINVGARRKALERQLDDELATDARYNRLSQKITWQAWNAATRAKVSDVQKVFDRIGKEDAKLGGKRPDIVQALRAAVQAQLDAAMHLRLRQDQWALRRTAYRSYQRIVEPQLMDLVRAQDALEAIRKLEGPEPKRLLSHRTRLVGGATRLQRVAVPEDLKTPHELIVGAWRFAESAIETRLAAATSGSVTTAWEASSAAAGALMLLARAQQEIKTLLEPPRLQ
jgi:hypothetical protein